jgi:hypothetical protein
MKDVFASLAKAAGQLGDPAVLRVAIKSVALTLLAFVLLAIVLYFALSAGFDAFGWETGGWAEAATAIVLAVIAGWLLFRVIALAVLQFFADEIVAAVEARHYPQAAATARALPFGRDLVNSLRGAGRAIVLNALALPVAAVLWITGIGPALVLLLVNAVLLGRELTEMTWLRHLHEYGDAQPQNSPVAGTERFALGGAVAALMLLPVANLAAPIIGAAAGTHLTHAALARRGAMERD